MRRYEQQRYQGPPAPRNNNYNDNSSHSSNHTAAISANASTISGLTRNQRKRNNKRQRLEEMEETVETPTSSTTTDVVRGQQHPEHLCLILCDGNTWNGKSVVAAWLDIETKLTDLVMEHVLNTDMTEPIQLPTFESGQIYRGYKQVKCQDEFSKEFLINCVDKLTDAFEDIKLTVLPISEMPPRPRALIWLPKVKPSWSRILGTLRVQNPTVPIEDWTIQKIDELTNSLAVALFINEESIEPLEKLGKQLYFGIRHCKLKMIPTAERDVLTNVPKHEADEDKANDSANGDDDDAVVELD